MRLHAIHDGREAHAKGELPEGALPSHVLIDDAGNAHEIHAKCECVLDGKATAISSLAQGDELELIEDNGIVLKVSATRAAS